MNLELELGSTRIVLTSISSTVEEKLRQLFNTSDAFKPTNHTIIIDGNGDWNASNAIDAIVSNLLQLEQQQGKPWIDATAFSAPGNIAVIVAGQSQAGKSTLSVAMFLSKRWQLVSEDVSFLDEQNCIHPRACAISLRPDAQQLFEEQLGVQLNLIDNEWFFDKELFVTSPVSASPSIFIILAEAVNKSGRTEPRLSEITQAEAIRLILPISNLIRLEDGVIGFQSRFQQSRFFKLSGGSVRERADALDTLVRTVSPQLSQNAASGSGG